MSNIIALPDGRPVNDGPSPDTLQKATFKTLLRCAGASIANTDFCAGNLNDRENAFIGGINACNGDSGGPLILNRNNGGNYELIGDVSRGVLNDPVCEADGQGTVFTDVYGNHSTSSINVHF